MQLSKLFTDDDGVSSVISVILMVAITVILAAVIATFALDLGNQTSQVSPEASFTFDYTDDTTGDNLDELNITHDGGDTIQANRLKISSSAQFESGIKGADATRDVTSSTEAKWSDFEDQSGTDSEVTASTELKLEAASGDEFNDATVRVIWESQEGDSTATLATFEGPTA